MSFFRAFLLFQLLFLVNVILAPKIFAATIGNGSLISRYLVNGQLNLSGEGPVGGMYVKAPYIFVADGMNNRVLIWNHIPTTNDEAFDVEITDLSGPMHAFTDGTKLFVADTFNNRVLIWNAIPTSNTTPITANLVLGQANFSDSSYNRGLGTPAANTMAYPMAVYYDGTRIYVADQNNARVLIWSTYPVSNGANADIVLGHDSFNVEAAAEPGPAAIGGPRAILVDNNKLYVSDHFWHRVLVWNSIPTESNTPANMVLGQQNFTARDVNRGNATPTANSLQGPWGLLIKNNKLYISDAYNNRILIWNTLPTQDGQSANEVVGQPDFNTAYTNNNSETANESGYNSPVSIGEDGTNFYVLDSGNNRVGVYADVFEAATPVTNSTKVHKEPKCKMQKPELTTWIKLNSTEGGMNLTWVQYTATKVDIAIDDGTGTYPWLISRTTNDGHEFLKNVRSYQKIKIKGINGCHDGEYSIGVSSSLYPNGWFNTK